MKILHFLLAFLQLTLYDGYMKGRVLSMNNAKLKLNQHAASYFYFYFS